MNDNRQVLPCVLIPMAGRQLLLPNVSIAEIVDYGATTPKDNGPAWLLGELNWRGLNLPVVSYDAANGGERSDAGDGRGRIAVLNTIGSHHNQLPFLALVTRGIPSQTRVEHSQLHPLEGDTGPADLMKVDLNGEEAFIPNLEYLEDLASSHHG